MPTADRTQPTRLLRLLTLLSGTLAIIQAISALRAVQVFATVDVQTSLLPPLEFVAGGLWAGVFALVSRRLLQQQARAVRAALQTLTVFVIYSTLRLYLFAQADYDRARLPFLLVTAALIAGIVVFYLVVTARDRDATRLTEKYQHECEPED
ncbi:MAG: hypothetical protein GYB67_17095 [Chloroflexi bacterium]|nr:hypothetical protein [Chloroflexota bacterium]